MRPRRCGRQFGQRDGGVAIVRSDLCRGRWPSEIGARATGSGPVGLGGRKKLQDFFVDRKVARRSATSVPLVVDETIGLCGWPGYGIDEAFRVTDPAQAVLILRLKALGGSA